MIPCDIAGCKNFIRHIENRFSQYFILFCFLKCSLGFVERGLSYRLRYTCPVCFIFRGGKTPSWDLWLGRGLTRGVDKCVLFHLHFYYIRQGSWDSYNLCVCVCLWAGLLQTWCYGWAYQSEVSIYFQWWSGPGYWSRSLFHFTHHCTIHLLIHILKWHFRKFVSISRTVSGCFLRTRRNDWCRQGNEFTTFWNTRIWNNVCDVRAAYSDGWTFQQYYFLRRLIASGLGHLVLKF